jgi:hypothetical protein
MNYFSPALIAMGASEGIINGSFILIFLCISFSTSSGQGFLRLGLSHRGATLCLPHGKECSAQRKKAGNRGECLAHT